MDSVMHACLPVIYGTFRRHSIRTREQMTLSSFPSSPIFQLNSECGVECICFSSGRKFMGRKPVGGDLSNAASRISDFGRLWLPDGCQVIGGK